MLDGFISNQSCVESDVLLGEFKFKLLFCIDFQRFSLIFGKVLVMCFGIFDFASTIVGKPEFFIPK